MFSRRNLFLGMFGLILVGLFALMILLGNHPDIHPHAPQVPGIKPSVNTFATIVPATSCPKEYKGLHGLTLATHFTLVEDYFIQASHLDSNEPGYVCVVGEEMLKHGSTLSKIWLIGPLSMASPLVFKIKKVIQVSIVLYSGGASGPATSICTNPWDGTIHVWDPWDGIFLDEKLNRYCSANTQ